MDTEPICPLCSSDLGVLVEHFTGLLDPGPIITGWKVVCEDHDHVLLTSNEYLDRVYAAEKEAEARGDDAEDEHRSWWFGHAYGLDEDQPFPAPAHLLEVLAERT